MKPSIAFFAVVCWWAGTSLSHAHNEGRADEWPQFRGPNRDGIAGPASRSDSWPEQGPEQVWRVEIGMGFSGIAVMDGKLYTMFAEGNDEYAASYHPADGRLLWRVHVGAKFEDQFGDGPRSTPTIDGDRVYVLGARGDLHALNKDTGETIWKLSLTEEFGSKVAQWGYSTSPLIEGELLLVEVGGGEGKSVAALDKLTGATRWHSEDSLVGYSSPIAVTFNGQRQFVFLSPQAMTANRLVSLSPTGQVLWRQEVPGFVVAMPVLIPPDKLFVSASNDDGCALLQMVPDGDSVAIREVWAGRVMRNHFNSSVYFKGHLYGFNNATLRCVEVATGEDRWSKRGYGKGSVILAGDRIIALSDRGRVLLVDSDPGEYREIGSFQAFDDKSWTSPTLAGGRLYLRSQKEMVCYNLQ